ncbi:MAG: tetratricopeptide repeat protein [Acidobacteriota bacterium]|nr:tetratricopeptide repeat protein [Acidobacteriota bacterium]
MGTQGWLVGFLPGMRAGREPDPRPLLQGELPRLVVLDYAETRLELVRTFLRDLALHQNGPKLRVVLLARRVADWWRSLQTDDDIDDLLARALVRKITPLTEAGKDRRESFQHCLEVFGARLTQGVPDRPWPDLEDAKYDRALYLHMAALAFLFGVAVHDADEALQWTLKHERDFWDKEIEREKLDGPTRRDLEETLPNLLAVVTLLGGCADRDRALDLAQRVVEPSRLARTAVDLLRRLYSGEEGAEEIFLEGLQPDLLGEELVRQRLQAKPALLSLALDAAEAEEEKVQILTVLTRLAQRVEAAVVWLDEAFAGPRLELLARVAPLVAVATGDPIGQRLARALSDQVPTKVLEGIVGLCEEPSLQKSVPLLELAAVATRLLVDRMPTGEFVENEKSRARLLHNLGVRLSALGLRREALAASCEATQIYRRLSVVEPHAFLPDLAMSLDSLGIRLSELGRRKEALAASSEATQLYRRLLEWNRNAFLPDLARSLNNQGIRLSELGREEKALAASKEATGLYRRLLERDGDAFLPDLARSLHNLGARLSQAGFHSQALAALEEATQAYRDLSGLRPDVFLPELASSLDNLGIVLGSLNRRSEAVAASREATQLYRVLSNSRPGAFLSDLAMSLSNLGNRLSDLDRHREALSASEESAQLYRLLAKSNRGAFVPDLARSLQNLGLRLFDVGCLEEALAAYKEAIVLLSPSFFQLPEAYAFWMGKMLGNYFQACSEAEAEPDGDLIGPIVELMDELDSASSEDDEEPAEQELAAEGGEEE